MSMFQSERKSLAPSELQKEVASHLSISATTVSDVLDGLSSVTRGLVEQGCSFNLCSDIFVQVGVIGASLFKRGAIVPTFAVYTRISNLIDVPVTVVQSVLEAYFIKMIDYYVKGVSTSIYGVLIMSPSATKSYDRVSYGNTLNNARISNDYRIRLVLSNKLKALTSA